MQKAMEYDKICIMQLNEETKGHTIRRILWST